MSGAANDRVVLIKGDNSKWYEQAIFIIKKNAGDNKLPMDFVKEAENIINSYMIRTSKDKFKQYETFGKPKPKSAGQQPSVKPAPPAAVKKHKSRADYIPYFAMIICCVILAYLVFTVR